MGLILKMLDHMNLIDTRRTFHPNATEYTFFSSAHGNMLLDRSHARCLIKFEMKTTSSIFYDHNTMTLEINYQKKTAKTMNTWKLNSMVLNKQWVSEEIKKKLLKIPGDK